MERQTNAFSIFLMVIVGVFVANMLTLGTMIIWSKYETDAAIRMMREVNHSITQSTQRMTQNVQQVNAQNRAERERIRREQQSNARQLSSIRALNDQTCNYWRGEFSKDRTQYNSSLMNEACSRAAND